MKRKLRFNPLHLLLGFILFMFAVSISVVFTLSYRQLYYSDINRLDIVENSGRSEEDIRLNYDALIDYSMAMKDGKLVFPTMGMSLEAETHFAEVKDIFDFFKWMIPVLGVPGLLLSFFFIRKREILFLKYEAVMSFLIPLVLSILFGLFFDQAFVIFHKIFFRNDYWLFDPEFDPIITILPDRFFLHCALLIFGGVLLFAVISILLYRLLKLKFNTEVSS